MCFSAEADVLAGVVVTAVGADALRQADEPGERVLGALPVLLRAHLLVEAAVWWGLTGEVAAATGRLAMWIYLAFALCVLPVLVPLAVRAVEPDEGRRRAMAPLGAAGAVLAAVYVVALVEGPVDVQIREGHLAAGRRLRDRGLHPAVAVQPPSRRLVRGGQHRRRARAGLGPEQRTHVPVVRLGGSDERGHRRPPAQRAPVARGARQPGLALPWLGS